MTSAESRKGPVLVGAAAAAAVLLAAVLGIWHAASNPREKRDLIGIEQLAKIDPALVIAVPDGTINTGIAGAQGIALDGDGRVYVAGAQECGVFDRQGAVIRRFSLAAAARCIAVGGDGTIFIGAGDHIDCYAADGTPIAAWPLPGGNAFITSVAADDSQVLAADAGSRTVCRFGRDGGLLNTISGRASADDRVGFIVPSPYFDLAIEDDDVVWIVNPGRHLVQNYSRDGRLRTGWGVFGSEVDRFCGCCNPTDIALRPDGSFVTSEKGLVRVKLYGPDGSFQGVIAGPQEFTAGAEGLDLAVDASGRILILDPGSGIVHWYVLKQK